MDRLVIMFGNSSVNDVGRDPRKFRERVPFYRPPPNGTMELIVGAETYSIPEFHCLRMVCRNPTWKSRGGSSRSTVLMAQFKSWRDYSLFAMEVRSRSRYVWSRESEEFLRTLRESFSSRVLPLEEGRIFWRAQLGCDFQVCQDGQGRECDEPIGYSVPRMTPLRDKALEGRANPKGIAYLYLSDKAETAMSEVRPWLGSIISIAQFRLEKDLNIIACISDKKKEKALSHIFIPPDESQYEEIIWQDIDSAFSKPVTRLDDSSEYAPTQIISESIKHAGYDGIIYRSNFGTNGYNIVVFDIGAAKLRNCGIKETKVITLEFEPAGNTYYVK